MKPILSMIMPSYFRPELLRWGLWSLSKQKLYFPYEIIVLNDGTPDDTEKVCKSYRQKLNIKYVFTGERNKLSPQWRVPGAVFNEGAKLAQGSTLILTSPEIFHFDNINIYNLVKPIQKNSNLLTIPEGKYDKEGVFLKHLIRCKDYNLKINFSLYKKLGTPLNTKLPFCMGISKDKFDEVEGFDPAYFEGFCFDDDDFVNKLLEAGSQYHIINGKIMHLYNSKVNRIGLENRTELWNKNHQIYIDKWEKKPEPQPIIEEKPESIIEDKINLIVEEKPVEAVKEKIELIDESIHYKFFPIAKQEEVEIRIGEKSKWYLKRIPKIAHFYWGEKELPFLRYLTISSFHQYNPDWEIKFYYPKFKQEKKPWTTTEHKYKVKIKKDYYEKLKELPITFIEIDFKLLNIDNRLPEVHKSDYLRWYLLSTIGGLWSDMDIIYFDSINKININQKYNKKVDTIVCYNPGYFSIGFMLSSSSNDFYKDLWEKSQSGVYKSTDYQTLGVQLMKPLMKDITYIKEKYSHLKIANLLMENVYSYTSYMLNLLYNSTNLEYIIDETIGVHWYAGSPLASKSINEITHENYKLFNNVVAKVVDISINDKKEETIEFNRGVPTIVNSPLKKGLLTIHSVCKDEPFIYYAIKSVYDYADKILLYDTGTTSEIALAGIKKLLHEDKKKKIIYKTFSIDNKEKEVIITEEKTYPNKEFGVGQIRQLMINDTNTEFFLLVDGDEVFYEEGMKKIVNEIIPNLPEDVYEIGVPFIWFSDMKHTCLVGGNDISGRLFRTDKVAMTGSFPFEFHTVKENGEVLTLEHKNFLTYENLETVFCHFNLIIKPEKLQHLQRLNVREFKDKLPKSMEKNPYFIDTFLNKKPKQKTIRKKKQTRRK